MQKLSIQQKEKIKEVSAKNINYTFFLAEGLSFDIKSHSGFDNYDMWGGITHTLLHGITFGGIAHSMRRTATWNTHFQNTYNNARNNPNLKVYIPEKKNTQVTVIGRNYLTIHAEGELNSKKINYVDIVKIELKNGLVYIHSEQEMRGRKHYIFLTILSPGYDKLPMLIEDLLVYRMRTANSKQSAFIEFEQLK